MASNTARTELTVKTTEDQKRLEAAINAGAIIVDGGRRRPFYFDGRFLTASDLIADQAYIRGRQSDLAQAIGAGVIRGLMVGLGAGATANNPEVIVEPGLGITPAGDLVTIGSELRVRLNAIPESQTVDAQLGIKLLATAGTVNRSGLFVLALRPVEFTSNPVPAYPTTLDGKRTVHDGDIIEATALTLIPYPDRAGSEDALAKRARVAREIFFDGQRPGVLQEALPIAMVYLDGGALRWLDVFMVRREVGAESTIAAGLRQRPRALLEAWLKQHLDHVDDIGAGTVSSGFSAARFFEVLPPVGLIPASTLKFETQLGRPTLTQAFFPPLVDCEFAFVPTDEIAALVDDALALPPIDLSASDDDLDHLSVLIVAGVTRQELELLKRNLENVTRIVRAAAPGMLAKRLPFESLIRIASPLAVPPPDAREQALAEAWQAALAAAQNSARQSNRSSFWFLRRRQLPYYSEISSATLRLAGNAKALDEEVDKRLEADKAATAFKTLTAKLPRLALAETVNVLAAPRLAVSPGLVDSKTLATSDLLRRSAFTALRAVEKVKPDEAHATVLGVARNFGDPRLGEGFDGLRDAADEETRKLLSGEEAAKTIAESGVAPQLDLAARLLPVTARADFGARLAQLAAGGEVDGVKKLADSGLGAPDAPR